MNPILRSLFVVSFVAAVSVLSAAPVALSAAHIEKHLAFASRHVAAREVDVWLPPGYDNAPERYPVVYMHDGQNVFDPKTSYTGVPWAVDHAAERLMHSGKIRGVIIVAIWNTADRMLEYMPQKAAHGLVPTGVAALRPFPATSVKSDAYLAFIVSELKPFIDHTYRTQPGRAHTFIMGSSMGGLISLYAVVEYPDVFGGAACLSTHWPAGDGAVIDYVANHLPPPETHRLYFDCGTRTLDAAYEPYQNRMDAVLRAHGYHAGSNWITRKYPGADHSEASWSQRVDVPLKFLLTGKP